MESVAVRTKYGRNPITVMQQLLQVIPEDEPRRAQLAAAFDRLGKTAVYLPPEDHRSIFFSMAKLLHEHYPLPASGTAPAGDVRAVIQAVFNDTPLSPFAPAPVTITTSPAQISRPVCLSVLVAAVCIIALLYWPQSLIQQ